MKKAHQNSPRRIAKLASMAIRQRDAFKLRIDGFTNQQIADQLHIDESVIRSDILTACRRLGPEVEDVATVRTFEVDRCDIEIVGLQQGGLRLRASGERSKQAREQIMTDESLTADQRFKLAGDCDAAIRDVEAKLGNLSLKRVMWAKRKADLLGLDEPIAIENKGTPLVQQNILQVTSEAAREAMLQAFGKDVRGGNDEFAGMLSSPAKEPGGDPGGAPPALSAV